MQLVQMVVILTCENCVTAQLARRASGDMTALEVKAVGIRLVRECVPNDVEGELGADFRLFKSDVARDGWTLTRSGALCPLHAREET